MKLCGNKQEKDIQPVKFIKTLREGFVPHNNEQVGKYMVSFVRNEENILRRFFDQIIREDRGKIDLSDLDVWRHNEHLTEQAKIITQRVIDRLNLVTGRKFHVLDVISVKREQNYNKGKGTLLEKYTVNLFIQEKNVQNVHAYGHIISFTAIVSNQNEMAIQNINFVTDYYYKRPLVDADNPYDRYFRIKNPFHLTQPFYTTDDKVLFDAGTTSSILQNTHKDLRSPKYRCFSEEGEVDANNKGDCDLAVGYYDKPVELDSECPFYKANKNYPNKRGGIDPRNPGYCEMPVGTKRVGYRFVSNDPAFKPHVYNCKVGSDGLPGTSGPCATEQYDKELYPNLVSPDYMFDGDHIERYQLRDVLGERGLNWSAKPTSTRDILNKKQKNPVFNQFISAGPG
jgi:hypothetical protein